jgi:hypothetical protein
MTPTAVVVDEIVVRPATKPLWIGCPPLLVGTEKLVADPA